MNLMATVRKAVEEVGYAFFSGPDRGLNGGVKSLPAAWLSPVRLVSVEGRSEGYFRYAVTLRLMKPGRGLSPQQRERLWAQLEHDAVAVCRRMEYTGPVCAVDRIGCVPDEGSLTTHGELSVTMTCTVAVMFCAADDCKR